MRQRQLSGLIALIFIIAAGVAFSEVKWAIFTGFSVKADNLSVHQDLNLDFNESGEYTVTLEGIPTSLDMTGEIFGPGSAKVYVMSDGQKILLADVGRASSPPAQESLAGDIPILLSYNTGTRWDFDDDGHEFPDGVVDFTVSGTSWEQPPDAKVCTRWQISSQDTGDTSFLCDGDQDCCNFLGLSPNSQDWLEPYDSYLSHDSATAHTEVSAQIVSLTDVVENSSWSSLNESFDNQPVRSLAASCGDGCNLSGFGSAVELIVELDGARIHLDSLSYTYTRMGQDLDAELSDIAPRFPLVNFSNLTIDGAGHYALTAKTQDAVLQIENLSNLSSIRRIEMRRGWDESYGAWSLSTPIIVVGLSDGAVSRVSLRQERFSDKALGCQEWDGDSCKAWEELPVQIEKQGDFIEFPGQSDKAYAARYAPVTLSVSVPETIYVGDHFLLQANFTNTTDDFPIFPHCLFRRGQESVEIVAGQAMLTINDAGESFGEIECDGFPIEGRVRLIAKSKGVSEELSHEPIRAGQPVHWTQRITREGNFSNITLTVPTEATKLSVESRPRGRTPRKLAVNSFRSSGKAIKDNVGFSGKKEMVLENPAEEVVVSYETPAPSISQIQRSATEEEVVVSSDFHYQDVIASTTIPPTTADAVHLFRTTAGQRELVTNATLNDTDGDGLIDYVEWTVPHLSDESYLIIIRIADAQHLDANRSIISDVYDQTKEHDAVWTDPIPVGDYIRVTFMENLTSGNDITLYARSGGDAQVVVYLSGTSDEMARFPTIGPEGYYRVLLTSLTSPQDVFDLRVEGGSSVEFDHIIDPSDYGPNLNVTLKSPGNATISGTTPTFLCNATTTYNIENMSLWSNITGSYGLTENSIPPSVRNLTTYTSILFWAPFDWDNRTYDSELPVNFTNANFTAGVRKGALDIRNGTGNNVTYLTTGNVNITNGTIAFWYNPYHNTSMFQAPGQETLWEIKPSAINYFTIYLQKSGIDGSTSFRSTWSTISSVTSDSGVYNYTNGTWMHVAFAWNNTNSSWYVNGALVVMNPTTPGRQLPTRAPFMTIGHGSGYGMDGRMDDFLIFNRTLTATEIAEIYNTTGPITAMNTSFPETLAEGAYLWTCGAKDSLNRSAFAQNNSLTVLVDTDPPVIDFIAPTEPDGTNATGRTWLAINVSVTDVTPVNLTFWLYNISGLIVSASTAPGVTGYNFTGISGNNRYYYNVTAQDAVGNPANTSTRSLYLDDPCVYSDWESDWIVNTTCSLSNLTIPLNGDLHIGQVGAMYLRNVSLVFNLTSDFQRELIIYSGGLMSVDLNAYNSVLAGQTFTSRSSITTTDGKRLKFYTERGSRLIINNSDLSWIGGSSADPTRQGLVANGSLLISNATFENVYSVVADDSWANISRSTFTGPLNGYQAIVVAGDNTNISNNDIRGYYGGSSISYGIYATGANLSVLENTFADIGNPRALTGKGELVYLMGANGATIKGNAFANTSETSTTGVEAISLISSNGTSIVDNTFYNLGLSGIIAATAIITDRSRTVTIANTSIESGGFSYIIYLKADDSTIANLTARNSSSCIFVGGNNNSLSNLIVRNCTNGLLTGGMNRSLVYNSYFGDASGDSGVDLESSFNNTFSNLSFSGNKCAFDFTTASGNVIADTVVTTNISNDICIHEDGVADIAYYNNTLINSNTSQFTYDAGYDAYAFLIQWPIRVLVNETNGSIVPLVALSSTSSTDGLTSAAVTGGDGYGTLNLTQFIRNGTTNRTEVPWTLNASKSRYVNASVSYSFSGGNATSITMTPYPIVNLTIPTDGSYQLGPVVNFSCDITDDMEVTGVEFWSNMSGSWLILKNYFYSGSPFVIANTTVSTMADGEYKWTCAGIDNVRTTWANANYTLHVRSIPPMPSNAAIRLNGTNVTINWTNSTGALNFTVSWSGSPSGPFVNAETTFTNVFNDSLNMSTKYYQIASVSAVGSNTSNVTLVANIYHFARKAGVRNRNWLAMPFTSPFVIKAQDIIDLLPNVTSVSLWNETTQQPLRCTRSHCDNDCLAPPICNFVLEPGHMYELFTNSSGPVEFNWSVGGVLPTPSVLSLKKDPASGLNRNWISVLPSTTLSNAQLLMNSMSNANSVTRWNESSQTSLGWIKVGAGIGKKFTVSPFYGYQVTVTENATWTQQ